MVEFDNLREFISKHPNFGMWTPAMYEEYNKAIGNLEKAIKNLVVGKWIYINAVPYFPISKSEGKIIEFKIIDIKVGNASPEQGGVLFIEKYDKLSGKPIGTFLEFLAAIPLIELDEEEKSKGIAFIDTFGWEGYDLTCTIKDDSK